MAGGLSYVQLWNHFGAGWNQLSSAWGSPCPPFTEATPVAHPATKTLPCQPNTLSLTVKDNMRHLAELRVTFYKLLHTASLEFSCKASAKLAVATEAANFYVEKIV